MNKRNKLNVNNSFLKGKTILITGGTGTFGENFAEKILKINNVKKIIIFSRDEYKQYLLAEKLKILDKRNILRFFIIVGYIFVLVVIFREFKGSSLFANDVTTEIKFDYEIVKVKTSEDARVWTDKIYMNRYSMYLMIFYILLEKYVILVHHLASYYFLKYY